MKTPKLLFAVAIVFAALSFSFKAKAQDEVSLYFTYNNYDYWSTPVVENWEIMLFDNNSNEDYYLTMNDGNYNSYTGRYHLGYFPASDYYMTLEWYGSSYLPLNIDYDITNGESNHINKTGVSMYDDTPYLMNDSNNSSGVLSLSNDTYITVNQWF